jgi:hypothetical protein
MSRPVQGVDTLNWDWIESHFIFGLGSPEGRIISPPGRIFINQQGGASTTLYVKETGTGNTGWVAK